MANPNEADHVGEIGVAAVALLIRKEMGWIFRQPLVESATPGHDGFRPLSSLLAIWPRRAATDIRFGKRRFDRCAISVVRQQTWQEIILS